MTVLQHPWRDVAVVRGYFTGRGSVLGPDTSRRTRWWELDLDCGHAVERTVRYRPSAERNRHRGASDILPAPKRVRCERCQP